MNLETSVGIEEMELVLNICLVAAPEDSTQLMRKAHHWTQSWTGTTQFPSSTTCHPKI